MKKTLVTLLTTFLATLSLLAIAGPGLQSMPQAAQQQNGQLQDTIKDMEQMMKSCAEMMKGDSK